MALEKLTKIDGGGISTTSDYRVGVITATKFVGPIEGSITSTDATFSGNVSIGGTLTYEDVKNIDSVGLITARSGIRVTGGVIEALAGENKIPSLYSAMGNLPSAGSYHGMFAHVHATGRGYFAHAGNWLELVNKEINGVVGTGTETYNIGNLVSTSSTTTSLNVVGVATFGGNVDVNGNTVLEAAVTVTTANGTVDFSGTISSKASQDYDFTINSGSGDVTLSDAVGAGANGEVGAFKINAEAGDAEISIEDIAGAGLTVIGSPATDKLTLTGTTYTTTDDAEYEGEGIVISGTNPTFTSNTKNIDFLDAAADKIKLGNSSNLTVNSTGAGSISFATDIIGSSGGAATDVTVDAGTGNVTVFAIGDATNDINNISLSGETVNLKGNVVTGNWTDSGTEQVGSFLIGEGSEVELFGASITIDTDNGDGNTGGAVTFPETVEADDANGTLTITSGEGKVTFDGIIGGTDGDELGGLAINSTAGDGVIELAQIGHSTDARGGVEGTVAICNTDTTQIDFEGAIYKFDGATTITGESGTADGVIDFGAGSATTLTTYNDTLKFVGGTIDLDASTNLTITSLGGAIEIEGIRGDSSETISISANKVGGTLTETVLIGEGGIGSADQISTIDITAADGITLQGDIVTSNAVADTDVAFTGKVLIEGDVTIDTDSDDLDGTITFSSTIDSGSSTGNLTILAGETAESGGLTMSGTIGGTTALGTLNINATAGDIAFTVPQIGDGEGLKGAAATSIGNAASGEITLSGTGVDVEYNFTDDVIFKSGTGVKFSGTDPTVDLDGSGKTLDFETGIELVDNADLTLTTEDGAITLSTIAGTGGGVTTDVTVNSGAGI